MKKCSRCKEWKPLTEFYKRKSAKDGLLGHCKVCSYKKNKLYDQQPHRRTKRATEMRDKRKTPHGMFRIYVDAAKSRNYSFSLSEEQFLTYWQQPCYYCGSEIEKIGLDRVDNTRGYETDNVVPCCTSCNKMKLDNTQERFYNKLFKIIKHLNLKGE